MNTDELIEKYFEDALSPAELQQFERRLKEDAQFAKAFALESDLMDGLEAFGNQNLRQQLDNIHQEEVADTAPPASPPATRRWWLAAAALLLLLAIAWLLWPNTPPAPKQLYAQYAQHQFDFTQKSNTNQLAEAERLLKANDYPAALPLLDNYINSQTAVDPNIRLAHGIALMESNRYEEATLAFEQLSSLALYTDEIRWYKGLLYLRQGMIAKSKEVLGQIPAQASRYKKAQELIVALGKIK